MKKRHMTVAMKERVRYRLLERKFTPLRHEQEAKVKAFATALVRGQLSPEEWRMADKLPDGWLPLLGSAKFVTIDNPGGAGYVNVALEQAVRVPSDLFNRTHGPKNMTEEQWATYEGLRAAEKKRGQDYSALTLQIDAQLAGFRTVEAAMEGWPEAADLIAEVVGQARVRTLPAITTLNAALDLPPDSEDKAA